MNELIKIETNENGEPRISGRELHEFLEVGTEYMKWTERYFIPFGFEEGTDFSSEMTKSTGGRPAIDHSMTIDMAKELCMIQRNERDDVAWDEKLSYEIVALATKAMEKAA